MDSVVAKLIFMQRSVYMSCMLQTSIDNVNNPTFQPCWKPKQALPKAICSVDTCDETVYRHEHGF